MHRSICRYVLWTLLVLPPVAAAAPDQPLLMPGKQSLYQRVLATPGAQLRTQPGTGAGGAQVTPFTAFYVYARRNAAGGEWLQVGTDRHGGTQGWLPVGQTLEWNQGLTVAFRDPVGHDRALLFRDADALRTLVSEHDQATYDRLYLQAESDTLEPDSPVVAIQPAGHVDINEDFYLVPIRRHEDVFLGSEQARLLQVSSVPLQDGAAPPAPAPEAPAAPPPAAAVAAPAPTPDAAPTTAATPRTDRQYTAGLVFVVDATLSMDPYIERTREAVMKIYDRLGDSGLLGHVNFGLVAYRDDPQAVPGLDYLARTFVTLEEGRNPGTFVEKVNDLRAATVSSRAFDEDAYAGIKQAIEAMDWQGHDARYVVLVTDAGAREADDPLASTGLSAATLRQLARDRGVAIFVLHLLTPAVMADHPAAARQYRELSDFPGIGSLYYGVPTGDVQEFGTVLDALAGQIADQVGQAVAGAPGDAPAPATEPATAPAAATTAEATATPTDTTAAPGAAPVAEAAAPANPQLAELQAKVARLGYALRLQYLRRGNADDAIPTVFDAWLLDRDFRQPERRTLDVRVLLTRDQLSDLHDILRQVLITAEEGLISPQGFLDELKSLAATLARDPGQLGATTAVTAGTGNSLADLGFMREYIEGLPYTGEVMNLSLEDWQSWPAKRQIAFLHRLEEKITYYKALHDHTDLWVSLDGGPVDGDAVFPIALDMLP